MLLKVGELARRTGLTVRTLHHYDAIGLLTPTGRSESGYRLYGDADVARLHGIQALQHLGLPLAEIGQLLDGEGGTPGRIVERQMAALDGEIERARELRERLALIRDGLMDGGMPGVGDWLDALALMTTYTKYFKPAELREIFADWKKIEPEITPLIAEVRAAMDQGLTPQSEAFQPLASRWMGLMVHWMDGDFERMERWGQMFRQEPTAQGRNNAPEGDMIAFIDEAIAFRLALLSRHLGIDEIRSLVRVPSAEWAALEARVRALMDAGVPPASAQGKAVAQVWDGLIDRMVKGDAALRERLARAWTAEPLLRAGSQLSEPVRDYIGRVLRAGA